MERQWKRKEENWPTKSTVGRVIYEEHMEDHHERLKLILSLAWAKNQSNETQERNFPNDWSELYAFLQCFEEKKDSLREDEALLKERDNEVWD